MLRKFVLSVAALGAMVAVSGHASTAHADEKKPVEIKLGTLAPRDSAWGTVFRAWAKAVKEESGNTVELTWFFNAQQGDETEMIGKARSKQLAGGAFTATGLSAIYPSVIAMQMPGLFDSWEQLDKVRNDPGVKPKLEKGIDDGGFKILGWGDVGVSHIMYRPDNGKGDPAKPEIRTPEQLKAYNTFYVTGDAIGSIFLQKVGVTAPRATSVPAILPGLSGRDKGALDVITAPAVAAEQLQWSPQLTHVLDMPLGYGIGALVINKDVYNSLPDQAKAALEKTGKNAGEALTGRIRGMDRDAWTRALKDKKAIVPNDAEKAQWQAKFKETRDKLKADGKVNAEIFDAVVKAAGKS
ncbi:MAG: TRAP-type C4-dicarboxylate transport system, periplasmic component [Labilithrix sp.]|nr:TRAP-type C4-dicarboxylate transport system, periplasmic component [Labilithrix sp.]